MLKTITLIISLILNVLGIGLLLFSSSGQTSTLSFYATEDSVTSALVVSIPNERVGTFGTVQITLRKAESASLQLSSVIGGRQANWIVQPLYDHKIVSVSQSSTGIIITALEIGETAVQTLTNDGISDIAIIKVIE